MPLMHAQLLDRKSNGIIGHGIKYIMFPLHLLRFCIFGTNATPVNTEASLKLLDDRAEKEDKGKKEEKEEKKEEDKEKYDGKGKKEERRGEPKEEKENLGREKVERTKEDRKNETPRAKSSSEPRKTLTSSVDTKGKTRNGPTSPETKDSRKETDISDTEESADEMVTAAEDSDCSCDKWGSANSTMIMNMSVDYDNPIDKSMPSVLLEEPMDISMEEQTIEKICSVGKLPRGVRTSEYSEVEGGPTRTTRVREQERSALSVDEEIARIFQKQCTSSSEDELSSSSSSSSSSSFSTSRNSSSRTRQSNARYSEGANPSASSSREKKESYDNEDERKKKTSTEFAVNKRRKTGQEDSASEKERRSSVDDGARREEKASYRRSSPVKTKTRSSRTPIKGGRESKRANVKYQERATQTDSAFSDEDVEMIPIDVKRPEKRFCCRLAARKSHVNFTEMEKMNQDLDYVADNEDSNDVPVRMAREQISSGSASSSSSSSASSASSSTDLGFEERICVTPDMEISMCQWQTHSSDITSTHRICITRAPPGFPQLPQNPPLTSCACSGSDRFEATGMTSAQVRHESLIVQPAFVPPAPTPMRHLYYDYPEFMNGPENISSSNILRNILKNNYYR